MPKKKTGDRYSAAAKRRKSEPRGKSKRARNAYMEWERDLSKGGLRHADRMEHGAMKMAKKPEVRENARLGAARRQAAARSWMKRYRKKQASKKKK